MFKKINTSSEVIPRVTVVFVVLAQINMEYVFSEINQVLVLTRIFERVLVPGSEDFKSFIKQEMIINNLPKRFWTDSNKSSNKETRQIFVFRNLKKFHVKLYS